MTVSITEAKVEGTIHEKSDGLATKKDIVEVKALLSTDVAELKIFIADVKAEMVRWMFLFWTGTVVTLAGIMIAILRFFPGK